MLVHIREIVPKAQKEKYAIGAFNIFNLETALGVVRAAVQERAPVILQVSETTIKYAGLKPITHIVETIAKNEAVPIPVVLHLDHGKSFHSLAECIQAGFTSVMIDASDLARDENIILTKNTVEYAHKRDVWVQGELGEVKGLEEVRSLRERQALMTKPEEAALFVSQTQVDILAVAVGNVHGIVKLRQGVPPLDQERLEAIHRRVKIPLVLHGASGLPQVEIGKAIENGVHIINIDTELRVVFTERLWKTLRGGRGKIYDPREVLAPCIEAVAEIVARKIEMFGSSNKA